MNEETLAVIIRGFRLASEIVGAGWIAVGAVYAFVELIVAHLRGRTLTFPPIRLAFSRHLSLALEFQFASDILSTAVAPAWDGIGKLADTATIRTALNCFLPREMRDYAGKQSEEAAIARRAEARNGAS